VFKNVSATSVGNFFGLAVTCCNNWYNNV